MIQDNKNSKNIALIYPPLGSMDGIIKDIPLSLIYAATDSVKNGYNVKILDLRFPCDDWRKEVDRVVGAGCSLVGLSVMTGLPIKISLEISRYIKDKFDIPIVWGGPHPTILPAETLENENIDFIVRGWGSETLCELITAMQDGKQDFLNIMGLGYKRDGETIINPYRQGHEAMDYKDIPYDLVDIDPDNYNRLQNTDGLVFPIISSFGCPYQCTFCMAPTISKELKGKKWFGLSPDFVIDHMEYLISKYPILSFSFYDDDSFVDLKRMYALLESFVQRGLQNKCSLEFRGARINELDKMDDNYLQLMVKANVKIFAIGVESGSDRLLKKMRKNITAEQINRVNNKLAKYPSLVPHYNFFAGMPGETMADLNMTKNLMLRLVKDNPACYIGVAADWKPLPGSVMTAEAEKDYGLKLPSNLGEWAAMDSFDASKITHPWYTKEMDNMIKLLQIAGRGIDYKIEKESKTLSLPLRALLVFLVKAYRPILRFRMKASFTGFLFEYSAMKALQKYFFSA